MGSKEGIEMGSKTHIVPTHLRAPETLLTVAGFNFSIRQFLLVVLGGATSYNLWLHLGNVGPLATGIGEAARFVLALLPVLFATALAFVRLAGRTLDRWLLVMLAYLGRPRRFVWRSIRFNEPDVFVFMEEQETDDDGNN
jgi:hypothetical protein